MAQNTSPIFGLTPRMNGINISTTSAAARSDAGVVIGTNQFVAFASGPSGSYVQKIRFSCTASTATTSVATVLRAHYCTVNTGTPNSTQAFLLGEISVGAIAAANANNATNFYELPLNFAMPANTYILVSQHSAQTTNQTWESLVIGSDY